MSAVTEPLGWLPTTAASASAASTIVLTWATRGYCATRAASSWAWVWPAAGATRLTFSPVSAETASEAGSYVSVTLPMFSPYEPVWTIGRVHSPEASGSAGPYQAYCLWVWPVKMTSTSPEVSVAMSEKAPPAAISSSSVAPSGVPAPAPSWYSATTTSASPLASSPSDSCAATRLTASTGSPKSRSVIPPGLTSVGVSWVTTPMTPTRTPSTSSTVYSSSAGFSVPFSYTFAPRYGHAAFEPSAITRSTRSA